MRAEKLKAANALRRKIKRFDSWAKGMRALKSAPWLASYGITEQDLEDYAKTIEAEKKRLERRFKQL